MKYKSTPFEESRLHHDWEKAVKLGTPNDFLICITASSKTSVSGSGKTTLTTDLAQSMDLSENGFDATEKASLDAGEIAYEIVPEIETQSAVVWDEAQGAPGTIGLDARRAMKQEAIDSISAILANRDQQFTIIITAQVLNMLDPRLYPMIDAWLLIRREPDDPQGPEGTYHKVHVEDYNLQNPKLKTPAIEDFSWNEVPADDPDYQELERLKQLAKTQNYGAGGEGEDGDGAAPSVSNEQRDRLIRERIQEDGVTEEDLASAWGISRQRINQIRHS